jgi:hypothetical protein
MRRKIRYLLGVSGACLLGLVVGFAFGQRQGFQMGARSLEAEVNGTLSIHVEAASCLRIGDTARALELLDRTIDAAVLSLGAQPGALHHPGTPFRQASLYRKIVPPSGPAASEVRSALDGVTPMELAPQDSASHPRSGLARLATQGGG